MSIHRRVTKVGGSLAVVIPRDVAELMDVEAGDSIRVSVVGRQMVIEPENDTADDDSFRRAFATVLRKYGSTFSGLAKFDRGED